MVFICNLNIIIEADCGMQSVFKQGRNAVGWSSTRLLDQNLIYFVLFL
jgi:hypothetical protein